MSTDKNSGGVNQEASGKTEDIVDNADIGKEDVVKYATYQKVLAEKKRRDDDLAAAQKIIQEFKSKDKERSESELKQKEDFKSLLQLREKELEEVKTKHVHLERTLQDSVKLDAFLKAVAGKVDDVYLGLINLDEVILDPTTNRPDPTSVQNAAREFEKKYSRIIEKSSGVHLPNEAAANGSGGVDYQKWLTLSTKEMKAKLADVMKTKT